MALCAFAGNADMYGLGIRLGYYLQWYGGIFASLLAPEEVPNARFALGLFISATFLALVIQTVQNDLHAVEIYIILLLTFGAYLFLVPQLLWRLVTGCQPLLDPSRFPLVDPGPTHSDLHTLLILAVTGYQLWFWFVKVPDLDRFYCRNYGFAFARVQLNSRAYQVINIVLYFVLGVAVLVLFTLRLNSITKGPGDKRKRAEQWEREKERFGKRRLSLRVDALQKLNLANNLITATTVVVATELTIEWNHITAVNTISSAGQLIPFVIGLGVVVRVLYVWRKPEPRPLPGSDVSPDEPGDPYLLPVSYVSGISESIHGRPVPPPLPEYSIPYASSPIQSRHTSRPAHTSRSKPSSKAQPRRPSGQHQATTIYGGRQLPIRPPIPPFQMPATGNAAPSQRPLGLSADRPSYQAPRVSTDGSSSTSPHPTTPLPAFRLPEMLERTPESSRSPKKASDE